MRTKPLPDRSRFATAREEIAYLYHKLLYWMYERENRARAHAFADRLGRLIRLASPGHDAIFPEECWSLICEAKGDLPGAIKHRENEVRLIKRLHKLSRNTAQEEDIFRLYGYDDLSDRLDLLAELYHDCGNLDKAIRTLKESKRVCEQHGIKFDAEDILHQRLAEKIQSQEGPDLIRPWEKGSPRKKTGT